MSATTNTKLYALFCVEYDEASGDLIAIRDSSYGRLDELTFELTPEDQPTALMIFTSCYPKKYENFMRRLDRPPSGALRKGARLPLFLAAHTDAIKIFGSKDVYTLAARGFIREPE